MLSSIRNTANTCFPGKKTSLDFKGSLFPGSSRVKPQYEQPIAIFSGGQPGIGKTSARTSMTKQFGNPDDFVVVSVDDLREKHPSYKRLRTVNDRIAYQQVYDDASIWMRKVIDYAKERGYNVIIIDSTMIQPEVTARTALGFRERGYITAAAIVAGHESRSWQQILGRYLGKRLRDEGRYVDKADHGRAYDGVLATAGVIDEDKVFDHVGVFE
ncbi:MAG: zeta toxin family protein, partial [Candidatus Dormibacteraceae bacterium]